MDANQIKELMETVLAAADKRAQADREAAEKRFELLLSKQQANICVNADENSAGSPLIVQGFSVVKDLSDRIERFVYDPENSVTFDLWYARYQSIFEGEAQTLPDATKVGLLLQKLSQLDYQKFANTILPKLPMELSLGTAVKELRRIFGSKESRFALRYKVFKIKKERSEDDKSYAARVTRECVNFEITKCSEEDLKMLAFVQGLVDSEDAAILKRLLDMLDVHYTQSEAADGTGTAPKLNLNTLVSTCERMRTLEKERAMVEHPETVKQEVLAVRKKTQSERDFTAQRQTPQQTITNSSSAPDPFVPPRPCAHCGGNHFHKDCPFSGKTCTLCHGIGHKSEAGFCSSSRIWRQLQQQRRKNPRHRSNAVSTRQQKSTKKFVTATVDGIKVKLQHDSGSDLTIISQANWVKLGEPSLERYNGTAVNASGEPIQILGCFEATLTIGEYEAIGTIFVSPSSLNLFGNEWMTRLNLWDVPPSVYCHNVKTINSCPRTLEQVVEANFPLLFSKTLGCCNQMKASLTLKPEAKPIYRRARPVPYAASKPIEDELIRLQCQGVIAPISYADYAAPIVVVKKKDGRIRITADYSTGLNDVLEPNKYPLPTQEGIMAKLAGNTIFTVIDMSDAFLQVELDDASKKLMPINTHCGLFQVNRLQPGVKTAPGIFQQLMDTMTGGIDGVFPWIDDIIIGGKDDKQHRERLFNVLSRMQEYGFTLKPSKCSFGQKSVEFLSHIIDETGIRPNPAKLEVIQQLPPPLNITQLRAFLGAVNWYGKFIPKLKDMRGPLDELLKDEVEYEWTEAQDTAFSQLKEVLASDLALTHYDPAKKIIVAADASSYGWGGVLMHQLDDGTRKPVMHVSGSFTKAEKNYAQVQREALALVRTLKKFHRFVYGRKFELQTDHQPLLAIFGAKNGIPIYTANRLQRYAENLLAYDFEIRYVDTKSFAYADFISRLIATQPLLESEDTVIATVDAENHDCFAIDTAKSLPVNFKDIQKATAESNVLQKVAQYVTYGWPRQQKLIPDSAAAHFFNRKSELSVEQGCLFLGDRIIIPDRFHNQLLNELHDGHPGVARMKLLARSKFFWPGMDGAIERMVRQCGDCAINARSPTKCTLQAWPSPREAWSRIHIDYAGPINDFYYLVIVDAFSNWPEIFKMRSITAAKTIDNLCEVFARQGICETIVSDNGPQFVSAEFKRFCDANGIRHLTSAPYHPQSNGRAERFVGMLKTGLKKLEGEGNAEHVLRKFLTCYRYTPSPALGDKSPFQLMTGREMRTKLELIKPPPVHNDGRNVEMEERFNAHHGAKYKEFKAGERVFLKCMNGNDWTWQAGTIIERRGKVNYMVQAHMKTGERKVMCHANQLRTRFTAAPPSGEDNVLMDIFELRPTQRVVEPIIVPQQLPSEEEPGPVLGAEPQQSAEPQQGAEPQQPRRSQRTTAGKLPSRFADYELAPTATLNGENCEVCYCMSRATVGQTTLLEKSSGE